MDTSKIIKGAVSNGRYTVTAPIVKEDYGLYLQIEGVELPSTYEVDFSNSENSGTSVTMIGNADGVLIPRQFIDTGKDIFAFLYHVGADFGRTIYKFRIPNKVRPDRTDEEPTPEQASTIDQAIAAVNEAVDTAEGYANDAADSAGEAARKAEEIEELTATAQTLAPGSQATATYQNGILTIGVPRGDKGEKGDTGERGPQGEQGVQGIQGIQGPKGDTGAQGVQGEQGIQGDKGDKGDKGDTGAQGIQGAKGDTGADGISPTVTITPITGGHRITITDADGEHSADVMDGDDYVLTEQDKQDIAELVDVPVDDVQINGTSIVENGVANVPTASASRLGVVKTSDANGIYVNSDGALSISEASSANVKTGTNVYKPITPHIEHEATFFGLAKASGDTTQSQSSNAVGQYTEDAKIAIQKMLGINQQGELIADITATEDVTEFLVNTDLENSPFELKKMIVIFTAGVPTTGNRDAFYVQATFTDKQNSTFNMSCPSLTYPAATSGMIARLTIDVFDGMPLIPTAVIAAGEGNTQSVLSMVKQNIVKNIKGIRIYQSSTTKSLIPAGSNIKVYGIRA